MAQRLSYQRTSQYRNGRNTRRPTGRPLYGGRARSGRGPRTSSTGTGRKIVIAAATALLAVSAAAVALFVVQRPVPAGYGAVTVLINTDAETAGNGLDLATPTIVTQATALAAGGGGTVYLVVGDGKRASEIDRVDLHVEGPEGGTDPDADARAAAVTQRLAPALAAAGNYRPSTPGRPVLPLLDMAADLAPAPGLPYHVIYVGFGLSDQDPAALQHQIGGMSASESVDGFRDRLRPMPGADLALVFTAAAGEQEPLNAATAQWRSDWWITVSGAVEARVGTVEDRNVAAAPAAGAAAAAPMPNIPEYTVPGTSTSTAPPGTTVVVTAPTPTVTGPTVTATVTPTVTTTAPVPAPVRLAGSLFYADEAIWLDEDAARQNLQVLADAWKAHPGQYQPLKCVGRTARYGPRDGALQKSYQRAAAALALAYELGVSELAEPIGIGYDDPLPDYPDTAEQQRTVTCELVPAR